VGPRVVTRVPDVGDVPDLARVHVMTWRETYRGVMRDEVLDDPGLVRRREHFWRAALTDERYRDTRAAVAELDGRVVGVALAGPPLDDDATWTTQLYVLYTLAAVHGSGVGAALLAAVLDPQESVALWVADPNPRAQAFYRRQGFVPDGTTKVDDGVHELRMVRLSTAAPSTQPPHRVVDTIERCGRSARVTWDGPGRAHVGPRHEPADRTRVVIPAREERGLVSPAAARAHIDIMLIIGVTRDATPGGSTGSAGRHQDE